MRLALLAALLGATALAASACGSSHQASSPTVSSTRLILGGAVRCTATVRTPVQVGHALGVSVSFHNISKRTVSVQPAYGGQWVVVKSADGTTYDTRVPLENSSGPGPSPIPLRPGATVTRHLLPQLRARWRGPLRVTPGCDASAAPTVRVAVTSPGRPASATKAVRDVVASTGHLLDHCRPQAPGVPVAGRIDAPSGDAPPLQARCSVSVRHEPGFDVADVLVVSPPSLTGVRIEQPYETISAPYLRNRNTERIAWEFVVTRRGATSVYSAENETSHTGGGRVPQWSWSGAGPTVAGDFQCGGAGGGFGGVDGPDVSFVSRCGG